jgi:mevalonate kinase
MKPYRTETFGKWILAGEHAVLRGSPAVAFPLTSRSLKLEYIPTGEPLAVEFAGENGTDLNLLFYGVLENALARLHVSEPQTGIFKITSSLPVGAGLGASAALCGAVGRWCGEGQGWIKPEEIYEFSRNLEDLFHGESSGVDLAVSLSAQGVRFVRGGDRSTVKPAWWPKLYLSYSGQRGMTSDCVAKVKKLFEDDPLKAEALDAKMREAVQMAEVALEDPSANGWEMLRRAINMANGCFTDWGLSTGELKKHLHDLHKAGASAVKPTGSGGGGYVLSLWKDDPPATLKKVLVAVPQPEIGQRSL